MVCKDRNGQVIREKSGQDRFIKSIYRSRTGRAAVKVLTRPCVSRAGGWILSRRISCAAIKPFIKRAGICMDEYEDRRFTSYNDFFTRKIKPGLRPVDADPSHFVSPCDGRLTVYPVTEDSEFLVKNTWYSLEGLTKSKEISERYDGGQLLLFRLTVEDYHRYGYADSGFIGTNTEIPGCFHTVKPAACDYYPVYKENQRKISLLESENFGGLLFIAVGALMVGKIINYDENKTVCRGDEMGRFEFGGSTIIICAEKGRLKVDEDILKNSGDNIETRVKYGMKIGTK